jgi:hypothetical protein
VRLSVIGRRDRLPDPVRRAVAAAEAITAGGRGLHLRVAVDYSARDAILSAARGMRGARERSRAAFARRLGRAYGGGPAPDVDLLIRTGGEQRLSDFLLWECAYAELWFTERMWPDFGPGDLAAALGEFQRRERRFGGVSAPAARAAVTGIGDEPAAHHVERGPRNRGARQLDLVRCFPGTELGTLDRRGGGGPLALRRARRPRCRRAPARRPGAGHAGRRGAGQRPAGRGLPPRGPAGGAVPAVIEAAEGVPPHLGAALRERLRTRYGERASLRPCRCFEWNLREAEAARALERAGIVVRGQAAAPTRGCLRLEWRRARD